MQNSEAESRLNVLFVDDDHTDLALMEMGVEQSDLNMWLQTATDPHRAVDYLEGRDLYSDRKLHPLPDLVVLDLDMPLSGGFDFLDWRRASSDFSSLPIVLLSANAHPTAIQAALSMGASAWLTKPDQLEDWNQVIEKIWKLGMENRQVVPQQVA